MRLVRLAGFLVLLSMSLPLGRTLGAQSRSALTGTVEGVVVEAKTDEPIPDAVVRLGGGPFDPAALERFKATLGALNVTLPPVGGASMDAYIETINDLAAARGMALNNPQLQNAINAFRNGQAERFRGQTDDAGHFSIQNLPPGQYSVTTQRTGYFAVKPAMPASGITVTANRMAHVTLAMTPGSTISGKISVPVGHALSSLAVTAYQITYRNGYPLMTSIVTRSTDERGQFRLYYIPPGDYLVAVAPRNLVEPSLVNPMNTAGSTSFNAPTSIPGEQPLRTFYPGTADRALATIVTVRDEREIVGIDIAVKTSPLYRVSGEVRVAVQTSTLVANSVQGNTLRPEFAIALHDPNVPDDQTGWQLGGIPIQAQGSQFIGRFQVINVPPGFYEWRAFVWEKSADGSNQPTTTFVPVEVRGGDVEGVVFDIHPSATVKGLVTVDGGPPGAAKVRVSIQPDGAAAKRMNAEILASRIVLADEATGTFSIAGVTEGRFHLVIGETLPRNLYIEDIRTTGQSVFDEGLLVVGEETPLVEMLLRSGAATVTGTVFGPVSNNDKKPAGGAKVVLVPERAYRMNHARFHTATADAQGQFNLGNVGPGNYKLFAWTDVLTGAYFNEVFLSRYEDDGIPIAISGQSVKVTAALTTLPREAR